MIERGKREQISWGDGRVFLDVGFAAAKRSSGLFFGDGDAKCFEFAEARDQIVEHVKRAASLTNLVIEAPLSVCFNKNGNPTGRRFEKETSDGNTKTRYWYTGLGCSVLVAATYLIRRITEAAPKKP